jgi:argininosuccinate lyase
MTDDSTDADANEKDEQASQSTAESADDVESVVRRERFSGGPARDFLSSLAADERIFAADIAVDRAHVVMLADQEIIDKKDASAILDALESIESAGHESLPDGEDVHEAIETAVIDRFGAEGGRMHTGRSRNDEVAACIRYRLREDVLDAIETVIDGREQLLAAADTNARTVMPGYTHLQPAQPTTVGHWLCSYEGALCRDTDRLFDAYERVNQSPLGGAAFAGTPFDVDRERTAELLGFDGLVENSMDAASARDFLVETTAAVATLGTTLSGMAEDVIGFANRGHVDLHDDYSSTSSIMPQKKNPDTLELVRGRTGDATAGLDGLLTTLKGLPRAYNRDLQRAGHHAWDAIDSVTAATTVAIGAVTTAEWPEDVLAEAAGDGFATATGVADLLAQSGVPFRTAHEVVAHAGELAADPDVAVLDEAGEAVLGEAVTDRVARKELERALDPAANVAMRDSRGGPAPETLEVHIERAEADLQAARDQLEARRAALADAHQLLQSEVEQYV